MSRENHMKEPTTLEDFFKLFLNWREGWLKDNPTPNFHPHEGMKKDSSGKTPRQKHQQKYERDGKAKQQQMLDEYPLLRELTGKSRIGESQDKELKNV